MPVVKIAIDESLKPLKASEGAALRDAVGEAIYRGLKPKPGTFQWVARWNDEVGPDYPVYLDIQFRASEARGARVVSAVMDDLAGIIQARLGAKSRIRAFAIDQSTLHARDG